ncbi:amidase signature domain-containing protein [Bisporella sp. PMI_857]|nr:amidase signature domain-containing protein [Bisporella sp. PMI_857]
MAFSVASVGMLLTVFQSPSSPSPCFPPSGFRHFSRFRRRSGACLCGRLSRWVGRFCQNTFLYCELLPPGRRRFLNSFLEHINLLTDKQLEPLKLDNSYIAILEDWDMRSVHVVRVDTNGNPRGRRYFTLNSALCQTWQLLEDVNGAFIFPVAPTEDHIDTRLFFEKPSHLKPQSGLRVGIKDNIDVKGTWKSNGNRAFQELYPPKKRSAAVVETLLAAGAIIVGKARAAADHGLFGFPSSGGSPTDSVFPVLGVIDTVGFFTRTMHLVASAARVLTSPKMKKNACSVLVELLYPTDIWAAHTQEPRSLVEPFLREFEVFLNVTRQEIDTIAHIQLYDYYQNSRSFLYEYEHTFIKKAVADPFIEYKWSLGKALTRQQHDTAVAQRNAVSAWVREALQYRCISLRPAPKLL